MATIYRQADTLCTDDGKQVIVQEDILGIEPARYFGQAILTFNSPDGRPIGQQPIGFIIPADSPQAAFENFEKAMQDKVKEIERTQQQEANKLVLAKAVDAVPVPFGGRLNGNGR